MGSGRGNNEAERLRAQADADRAAIKETEEERQLRELREGFRRDRAAGVDVKDTKAMESYYNLFEGARRGQNQERKSEGILSLARGGNAGQAAAMDQANKYLREQNAAGELENAYNNYDATSNQYAFNWAQLANSRNIGKAQISGGAYESYMNRQAQKTPWWKTALGLAIGGVSAIKPKGF